ncbi:uncharacterized protein METZ01_LOCUS388186, partial [marine metagenome]
MHTALSIALSALLAHAAHAAST